MNLIKNSLKAAITIALALLVSCTTRTKQSQTTAQLPKTGFIPAANHDNGWQKLADGPVLGNSELGTCFDVNVIPDGPSKYNMYFSWRPKMAIAVSRSENGTYWTDPVIVLEHDETSGWEDNLNRSCTIFWNGKYHMWYTGQARGRQFKSVKWLYFKSKPSWTAYPMNSDPSNLPLYHSCQRLFSLSRNTLGL